MKVKIKNLTFDAIIGILPKERIKKQPVVINCTFKYNYTNGNFIDYSKVSEDMQAIMKNKKFELLEEAVLFIKSHLKKSYKIKKIKLYIAKPTILDNCIVEVGK